MAKRTFKVWIDYDGLEDFEKLGSIRVYLKRYAVKGDKAATLTLSPPKKRKRK